MKFLARPRTALSLTALVAFGALPQAAAAQDQPKTEEADRPFTDREVNAQDVAMTPLSDLNLRKGEIPPLLLDAQDDPYDLSGMTRCSQLATAIGELDAVLGDDLDVAQAKSQRVSAGRAAQAALGSFIPFRGLIREVSGANAHERKVQVAILAGSSRRAFLKGVGQQRGCRYPARSATPQVIAAADAETEAAARAKAQPKQDARRQAPHTVSRPVVQQTP